MHDTQLSPNFKLSEFNTRDGTPVPASHIGALRYLCREFLEPMRAKYGPCTIHSGYRHANYNRRIGGARNSFHIYDQHPSHDVAADVSFRRGSVRGWRWKANQLLYRKRRGKGGLGYYPQGGFIHIDTRDYRARWNGS